MDPLIKKTSQKRKIKGNERLTALINRTCSVFIAVFLSLVSQPFTRSVVKFCSFVAE